MTEEKKTAVDLAGSIFTITHKNGEMCGFEAAAKELREQSGHYYSIDKDEYARMFRLAATMIEERAAYLRVGFESRQEKKDEAYTALEEIDWELEVYRAGEKAE